MSGHGSDATGIVRWHPMYPPLVPNDAHPTVPQKPDVQAPVTQSDGARHVRKSSHRGHAVEPPQSTSVSPPFCTPSLQVGAAQSPLTHEPLRQSLPVEHVSPTAQPAQAVPPQSTSDSSPF
jgi:hypothetical protein